MNPMFQQLMTRAATLTQGGDLQAATEAIQRALNPDRFAAEAEAADPVASPRPARPYSPFAHPVTRRPHHNDDIVIEGCTRVVDDTAPPGEATAPAAADARPAATSAEAVAERWTDGSFSHQGRTLAYKLYVPPHLAGSTPAPRPLVLMLHGCTQNPADFAAGTQMNDLARREGFVVVYPAQTAHANSQKCWNWFKKQHQQRGRGEPALLAALVEHVARTENVDRKRIYAAGLSAGGAMADILGQTYPDLFAAVGVHSGLAAGSATDVVSALSAMRSGGAASASSRGTPSAPVIVFHGDADSTVNPVNAKAVVKGALDGSTGGQTPRSTSGTSSRGQGFVRTDYPGADGTTAVELWMLHGAGHAWSGGSAKGSYTDARGVDASAEMVRFFLAHPRAN